MSLNRFQNLSYLAFQTQPLNSHHLIKPTFLLSLHGNAGLTWPDLAAGS